MSKAWAIILVDRKERYLFGKLRTVITYDVVDESGEIHPSSMATADRQWIRPACVNSNKLRNKWQRMRFNSELNSYYFLDKEFPLEEPFIISNELIKLLDDIALDEFLSENPKLD